MTRDLTVPECPELTIPAGVLDVVGTALDEGLPVLVCGSKIWWTGEVASLLATWSGAPYVSLVRTLRDEGFPTVPTIAQGMVDVAWTVEWLTEAGEWPGDPRVPVLSCPRAGHGFGSASVEMVAVAA